MAEWLIEQGVGEERALLVEHGHALAARLQWPGELVAGLVEDALLVERPQWSPRGRVRFSNGQEAMADKLPKDAAEGARLRLEVTRGAIIEASRSKPAQARPTQSPCRPSPSLAERLGGRVVPRFPKGLWEEVWAEALAGTVEFPGGSLHFSPTPAMVLVDVDGFLGPVKLALAAVPALAGALARFGLSGSIGVDFPTLQDKADRKAVDVALGVSLADWDHERTAMNGFGFVQLVSRLEGPSLLHRLHFQRNSAAARLLLRQAEMVAGRGAVTMRAHPAVVARLEESWLLDLQRRTGCVPVVEVDPGLAPEAGFAQAVTQ